MKLNLHVIKKFKENFRNHFQENIKLWKIYFVKWPVGRVSSKLGIYFHIWLLWITYRWYVNNHCYVSKFPYLLLLSCVPSCLVYFFVIRTQRNDIYTYRNNIEEFPSHYNHADPFMYWTIGCLSDFLIKKSVVTEDVLSEPAFYNKRISLKEQ